MEILAINLLNVTNNITDINPTNNLVTFHIVETLFCVTASLVAIPANIFVILCLSKDTGSKTSGFNTYCMFMAVTDFLVGMVLGPLRIFVAFREARSLGQVGCIVWKLLDCGLTSVSMFLFLAMGYDRQRSLTDPLGYRSTFSKYRATRVSLLMWILGFAVWIPFIIIKLYVDDRLDCPYLISISENIDLIQVTVAYVLPLCLLGVTNGVLIVALRKPREVNRIRLKRTTPTLSSTEGNFTNRDICSVDQATANPSCSSFEHSDIADDSTGNYKTISGSVAVGREISNVSYSTERIFETAENIGNGSVSSGYNSNTSKANPPTQIDNSRSSPARKVLLMIITFVVCWLPIIICWFVNFICSNCVTGPLVSILVDISYFQSAANPTILIVLSRTMRSKVTFCLGRTARCKNPCRM